MYRSIYGPDLLRAADLPSYVGLSRSYIYKLIAQDRFPQPYPLVPGSTSVAWLKSEVKDWKEIREQRKSD